MIIPPLVITTDGSDVLIARARLVLDEGFGGLKADGMLVSG